MNSEDYAYEKKVKPNEEVQPNEVYYIKSQGFAPMTKYSLGPADVDTTSMTSNLTTSSSSQVKDSRLL